MYLYFDKDGILLEMINDEASRQYNQNVNDIYVYIENEENPKALIEGLRWLEYSFELPNGKITETYSTQSHDGDELVLQSIPVNTKRDLKHFKYGVKYKMHKFRVPCGEEIGSKYSDDENYEYNVFEESGVVGLSIVAVFDVARFVLGKVVFNVEEEVVIPTENVSVSQFEYLLNAYSKSITRVKGEAEDDYRGGDVNITKANIGLGNVDDVKQVPYSEKGEALGVATLNENGIVPIEQLPPLLELGETADTAYAGDKGKQNADDIAKNAIAIDKNTADIEENKIDIGSNAAAIANISARVSNVEDINQSQNDDIQSLKSDKVDKTTTINGQSLRNNVVLSANDVGAEPAFEKNTAFNKNFGNTSGTVVQGNDVRFTNLANDIEELQNNTASDITTSINNSTYVMTVSLKNDEGTVISSDTVDFPLESVVVSGDYDEATKEVVLTLQNGSEVRFSVADLIDGLVPNTRTINGHALTTNVTVTKSDIGLGNVANERQYSENNPPPYDSTLSSSSENAVQNAVIAQKFAEIDEQISGGVVGPVTEANKIYATNADGEQTTLDYGEDAVAGNVVVRSTNGNVPVPSSDVTGANAISKEQADSEYLLLKSSKSTTVERTDSSYISFIARGLPTGQPGQVNISRGGVTIVVNGSYSDTGFFISDGKRVIDISTYNNYIKYHTYKGSSSDKTKTINFGTANNNILTLPSTSGTFATLDDILTKVTTVSTEGEVAQELTPNVFYNFTGALTSLTLTFGAEVSGIVNEYKGQFVSGETAPTVIFPSSVVWVNGLPTIEANKTYQFSILNNQGVILYEGMSSSGETPTNPTYTITTATEWTGDTAPYSQRIWVTDIIETDTPIADVVLSDDYTTAQEEEQAWAKVFKITTADGYVTVYAKEPIAIELNIQLKVVR